MFLCWFELSRLQGWVDQFEDIIGQLLKLDVVCIHREILSDKLKLLHFFDVCFANSLFIVSAKASVEHNGIAKLKETSNDEE